jgi:hypothetical protein
MIARVPTPLIPTADVGGGHLSDGAEDHSPRANAALRPTPATRQ